MDPIGRRRGRAARWRTLLGVAALGPLLANVAAAPEERDNLRSFDRAWSLVRGRYYDATLDGVDWVAARRRYRQRAAAASSRHELHEVIREMLGELDSSHVALFDADVYRRYFLSEARGEKVRRAGLLLARLDDGVYVQRVLEGGAAERAGLLRGDRIVAVDGAAPEAPEVLRPAGTDASGDGPRLFFLGVAGGEQLRIQVERRPGKRGSFVALLRPAPWSMLAATRASVTIHRRAGIRIGSIHLWHFSNQEVVSIFEEALRGPLGYSHGLVLDLRGRGGAPLVVWRLLRCFDIMGDGPKWEGPVVALVDGATRSAKEAFAFHFQRRRIGAVVGERTSGAVLGARFFELPDGAQLMLPYVDMRALTDGIVLEGRGVEPDIEVKAPLRHAGGRDPIFERGLEEVFWRCVADRRRARRHGWF